MDEARPQLVGPFPPGTDFDEYDRLRRRVLWRLVTGLYLVGSLSSDERNLMTCNWVTQVSIEPKLIALSVEKSALTHRLIAEGKVFCVSLLAKQDRAIVRKFVKPAEDDRPARTLNGFPYRDAPVSGAPIIAQGAAYLDCRVVREVELGSHSLFVGEVVDAGVGPHGEEVELLRMEDTRMSYGG